MENFPGAGVGFMREAEAPEPEGPQQSHVIAGSGDGEEWWTTFLGDEMPRDRGSHQKGEGWEHFDPVTRQEGWEQYDPVRCREGWEQFDPAGSREGWEQFDPARSQEGWEQCDPAGSREGVGFMREAEALDPEEPEQSHVIAGSGDGEEWWRTYLEDEMQGACGRQQRLEGSGDGEEWWTTFLGDEMQGAYGSQQRLDDWDQYDPVRRDSLFQKPALLEGTFFRRGVGFMREGEALDPEGPEQSHLIAGTGGGEEWWTTFLGDEMQGACGSQQILEGWEQFDPVRRQEGWEQCDPVRSREGWEQCDPVRSREGWEQCDPVNRRDVWGQFVPVRREGGWEQCDPVRRVSLLHNPALIEANFSGRGVGFMRKAEAPDPEGPEQSHLIAGSGGGEQWWTAFQGHEMQGACGSQQRLESWEQFDPVRRDSLLHNPAFIEATFSGREVGSTECAGFLREAEALEPEGPEQSHIIAGSGDGEEWWKAFQGHEKQRAGGRQQRLEGWGQFDAVGRKSLLHNPGVIEGTFSEREVGGTECEENCRQRSGLPSRQPATSQKETHTCSVCGRSFEYKSLLTRHEKSHTGEKPYTCAECGKSFSRETYLTNHGRVHTGEKPYICSECGKAFTTRDNLRLHQNLHRGKKPHLCLECGESFVWNSQLVAHSVVHTGELPFKCPQCGQSFKWQYGLRAHMKIHEKEGL